MTLPSWDASLVLFLLATAVVAMTALAIAGRWDDGRTRDSDEESVIDLRAHTEPVTAQMLRDLRFTVVLRGYRMAEVDALLERLRTQVAHAEALAVARHADVGDSEPTAESHPVS